MENELCHVGILGMKWGHRKGKSIKRETTKKMSDSELQKRINRLQMEQRYSQLKSGNSYSKRGKEAVRKTTAMLGTIAAASTAAITLYNNSKTIKHLVRKMINK